MKRFLSPCPRTGRRVRRTAAALALVVGPAALAAAPAHAEVSDVVVRGVAVEPETGTPLAGICVRPLADVSARACPPEELTGADGRFEIDVTVPDGVQTLDLAVTPPAEDLFHDDTTAPVTAADGWEVEVSLPRLAAVKGRVLSTRGGGMKPVAGVCASTGDRIITAATRCTGADGVYLLPRLTPSEAALVRISGEAVQDVIVPGTVTLQGASTFELKAGVLRTLPDTKVKPAATVVQPGGGSHARLLVIRVGRPVSELAPQTREWEWTTWSDDGPQWSVEPGRYLLAFTSPDGDCGEGDSDEFCPDSVPIWYPGTVDRKQAKPVQLKPGRTLSFPTEDPTPEYRTPLTVTVTGVPTGSAVEVEAHWSEEGTYPVELGPGDAVRDAEGNVKITARYLPQAPFKVKVLVTRPGATGPGATWVGGWKYTKATVITPDVTSVTVAWP